MIKHASPNAQVSIPDSGNSPAALPEKWIALGAHYRRQNCWDIAEYYYDLALEAAALCGDVSAAAECTYCIGVAHLVSGRAREARTFLEASLELHRKLAMPEREDDIATKLGLVQRDDFRSQVASAAKPHSVSSATTMHKAGYSILLLGAGQQGRAALFHLANSPEVARILVVDANLRQAQTYADQFGAGKTDCLGLDVRNRTALSGILQNDIDVVIDVLPKRLRSYTAPLAVQHGVHLVNTFRDDGDIQKLHSLAQERDVAIITGVTIGPTIKQMICCMAIQHLDQVDELRAYAGGFPEQSAADNPLKYKFTWTPGDFLLSYQQPARLLRDNQWIELSGPARYQVGALHSIQIDQLGELTASPAGDFAEYVALLGLESSIRAGGSYIVNWPGHYELIRDLFELGLFHGQPVNVGTSSVVPRELLREVLTPRLQYHPGERDVTFMRAQARGLKAGQVVQSSYDLLDYGDLSTGFLSQSRVVGFAASIVAQMIARREISERGVLSAVRAINPISFFESLSQAGMQIIARETTGLTK